MTGKGCVDSLGEGRALLGIPLTDGRYLEHDLLVIFVHNLINHSRDH